MTTLLLVEDDPDIRDAVSRLLMRRGYEVRVAVDGVEALTLVREGPIPPELIIMDLRLPRMNGWDAIAAIRADFDDLPIIALTGDTSREDRERATSAGADLFIAKPIRIQLLCDAIESLMSAKGKK